MNYKVFLSFFQKKKPTVSFDFDGVLHTSLIPGTGHPINFKNWKLYSINQDMVNQLKQEAIHNRVIITSSRDHEDRKIIKKFVEHYRLPVAKVVTTQLAEKLAALRKENVVRHYDDSLSVRNELENSEIECVFVKSQQPKKMAEYGKSHIVLSQQTIS